ncbi:glutathione S-transferase [Alteromonadaceae bacterium 2753L.S.0a.02]|nr:glutathione S-transferase [Alteromonadaceae bacterium 2753L.S.0a.02]
MYTVYGDMLSGNCYKIKMLMQFLNIPHQWQAIDILKSETHSEEFLAMNANGKIPVLKFEDGTCLSESNAILYYLAENTRYLPQDSLHRARVLQWQFFEQYSHEPFIAVARFINLFLGLPAEREAEFESKKPGGYKALGVMEQHLSDHEYFVGDALTIADISLYAYTHVAHEGGFDLSPYSNISAWLTRIEQEPGYIAMSRENG